jgi:tetratricopeptide (TPR) repeat protein
VQVHLLGDGALWVRELTVPLGRLEGEPLTIGLVRLVYGALDGAGEADAERVYRGLSLACGVLYVLITLSVARWIGRSRVERVVAGCLLLSLGTVQLFFGYVEHYAPVTVAVLFYLQAGVAALEGKRSLAWAGVALGFSCALHLVALVLVPSFALLALRQRALTRLGLWAQAVAFPLTVAVLVLAVGLGFGAELIRLSDTGPHTVPLWSGEPHSRPHTLLSAVHIVDVINGQLLAFPIGLPLCLLVLAGVGARVWWSDPAAAFLGAASAGFLAFSTLFNPEIGAFRDWDLSSISAVPLATLAAYLLARHVPQSAQGAAGWIATAVALFHLFPWLGVNADDRRSVERFETLLEGESRLSLHALGASYDELRGYHERQGNHGAALRAARHAFRLHPRHARYLSNVLRLLDETDSSAAVETQLLQAIRTAPDFVEARLHLARYYRKAGRFESAVRICREALELDPDQADAYVELGTTLDAQGLAREAAEALEQAVALDGENARAHTLIGVVYGKSGRMAEGIKMLQRAVSLGPDDSDAWANLGVAYHSVGRTWDSEMAFRRSLSVDADNPAAKNGLGIYLKRRGEIARALALFQEAAEEEPDHIPFLLNVVSAAYQVGDLRASLGACERILAIDATNRDALHNICALYIEMGREREAEPYIKRYNALYGNPPGPRGAGRR